MCLTRRQNRRDALAQGVRRMNREAMSWMGSDRLWYVGVVQPQKEFLAQRQLTQRGVYTYLPLARRWRRIRPFAPNKTRVTLPALTGYVFLAPSQSASARPGGGFAALGGVACLRGLLGADGAPQALCGDRILTFLSENDFDVPDVQRHMRTGHAFGIGDKVQIMAGPFDGHVVDVRDIRGPVAKVLVSLLGGDREIDLPVDNLEKAS